MLKSRGRDYLNILKARGESITFALLSIMQYSIVMCCFQNPWKRQEPHPSSLCHLKQTPVPSPKRPVSNSKARTGRVGGLARELHPSLRVHHRSMWVLPVMDARVQSLACVLNAVCVQTMTFVRPVRGRACTLTMICTRSPPHELVLW